MRERRKGRIIMMSSVAGLVTPRRGSVRFDDTEIGGSPPHAINRRGIAYVPDERRIFADLTVTGKGPAGSGRLATAQEDISGAASNDASAELS